MRISPDQLSPHLQKPLLPLYAVFGDEPLLAIEAADLIRAAARKQGYTEREIFTVEQHFKWDSLKQSGDTRSLFAERRVMDIRIPTGKPGLEGGVALAAYCQRLPDDTVTLVSLPKIDKTGQASKWFKALEKAAVMVPVAAMERARLSAWIGQRLALQQQQADSETLQFVADKVEGNLLAAHQEIQKLALLYPAGKLSFNQVKEAVLEVARYDVFDLTDAMLSGDAARYTRIAESLQGEGAPLPLIVSTLAAQIRSLILIRKGLDAGRPMAQLMVEARVWGDKQNLMERAAQKIKLKNLVNALLVAAKIDRISKGVAQGDAWDELLQLGLLRAKK